MDNSSTTIKLKKLIQKDIENKKNIRILEFGVNFGDSTKFFLDICEKNNGNLILYLELIQNGYFAELETQVKLKLPADLISRTQIIGLDSKTLE